MLDFSKNWFELFGLPVGYLVDTGELSARYRELQRLNAMWNLEIGIVNATGAFAAMNLAGPKSRVVLRKLTTLDLSNEAFPYLGLREAEVAGVPVRLMRVGFVGELGFEIHMPADRAAHLWDALMDAGKDHDIRPFGVEAQRLLRLEKGHIIIGQDTDGLTQPDEAGLEWAVKMDKPAAFTGREALGRQQAAGIRKRLVMFTFDDPAAFPWGGEPILMDGSVKQIRIQKD